MWEVRKVSYYLCPYTSTSSELKRGSIKLINTSHSQGSVKLPSSSPLSFHHHHCHSRANINNYIYFFKSYYCLILGGEGAARVGQSESPITKLSSSHLFPWAGSQIQFLFTSPQPCAVPMAKNK